MAKIKTAEQRIHKLEGGEGDSFVTVEQALIAERDELRAAGAAPVPEGWQLVPVEPTPEMCDEGAQAIVQWENGAVWPDSWGITYADSYRKDAMKAYKAMLAAATPKEPT